MSDFTQHEINQFISYQKRGEDMLDTFLSEAFDINIERMNAIEPGLDRLGIPHFSLEDLAIHRWYIDNNGNVCVPNLYEYDELVVPSDVLTGSLTPFAWVESLWNEYYEQVRDRQVAKRFRDIESLRKLSEKYPNEAKDIVNG